MGEMLQDEMDEIVLKGMRFFAYHGVFPEEQKLGQRFTVNLRLQLDLSTPGRTDDVKDTVDYGQVYERVQTIMEGGPFRLLETAASRIADALLQSFPSLSSVKVEIEKPSAPIAGIFDSVGVAIHRKRDGS
ncbi:dihydroneopterin aldolase [Alicyclobacillus tolerans]|uniref:dihydroneopterin aldolase n=1 Tax=Alicyclobacillus tolerans TaxID=90970 RepID=UPI001F01489C|nr:dihydroneopterin aldolase [Alicyclobacillus tolerans]MCF8566119.1 dihydroneopterin aldolase [Alicyclobacillus tolerans]